MEGNFGRAKVYQGLQWKKKKKKKKKKKRRRRRRRRRKMKKNKNNNKKKKKKKKKKKRFASQKHIINETKIATLLNDNKTKSCTILSV